MNGWREGGNSNRGEACIWAMQVQECSSGGPRGQSLGGGSGPQKSWWAATNWGSCSATKTHSCTRRHASAAACWAGDRASKPSPRACSVMRGMRGRNGPEKAASPRGSGPSYHHQTHPRKRPKKNGQKDPKSSWVGIPQNFIVGKSPNTTASLAIFGPNFFRQTPGGKCPQPGWLEKCAAWTP